MRYNIKYLYRVIYKDGTCYDQNIQDISMADSSKSCYYDIKIDDIEYFILSDGINSWSLDLKDGGFSINGGPKFYLTTDAIKDTRLNHYRRVTMNFVDGKRVMIVNYVFGFTAETLEGNKVLYQIIIN